MTKKALKSMLFLMVMLLVTPPLQAEEAKVSLASGKTVKVTSKRLEGQAYFPLRTLSEGLGIQYTWVAKNSTATLSYGKGKLQVSPNKKIVLVKGKEAALSWPPKLWNKHLYVPGEFLTGPLAELLGQEVAFQTSATVYPDKPGQKILKGVRWYAYPAHTRVVLDLSQPVLYEIYGRESGVLKVLIKEASLTTELEDFGEVEIEQDQILRAYSVYTTDDGVMVEMALHPAKAKYNHFVLKNPVRMVLDIGKGEGIKITSPPPKPEVSPPAKTFEPPAKPQPPAPSEEEFKVTQRPLAPSTAALKVIVLDAGHGDFDPGAVGPTGLREKDVVLDVALRLAPLLERDLGLKVILTRKTDVFVPLRERTRIANRHQADLFVSIHANADKSRKGRGVETFFLDLEPSDEEARAVAAMENGVINLEKNAAQELNALANLLWDLTETAHQRESSQLAEEVQTKMEKSLGTPNRGVKTAHFYVLRGALMPAILTEIGFISHREEEKKLRDPEYRQMIAETLYNSIAEYKNIYEKRMGVAKN